jgi:methylenetetrahydrofolate reductase (NADPH)
VSEISIELVPRSLASIERESLLIRESFPSVRTVNIPDLLRMELRSWEACVAARAHVDRAIPHLRAMDFDPDRPFPLVERLREGGLDSVLVVTGDPPQDMARRVYPTTPVELIAKLRRELPELRIYAGFDPYRTGIRQEVEYARAKLDAGADGLFSQPFFDLRLMQVWSELLAGCELWWGVSPVLRPQTRRYWETKNQAFFPADFEPTMKWSRRFARQALEWVTRCDHNLYFMPIRAELGEYLGGIL